MAPGELEIVPVRKQPTAVTPAMRVALRASSVVFHVGALIHVTLALWIALAGGLLAGAGGILGRTRGLDHDTFATSLVAAVVLDVLLFVGIGLVWLERLTRSDDTRPEAERFTERHPVIGGGMWLLGALCVTTAAAWWPSAYFPESWTTVVVLANVIYFALVGAVVASAAMAKLLEAVRVRALTSHYRAGAVTAAFLVLGLGGAASWATGWQEELKDAAVRELRLERVSAAGSITDGAVRALCVADEEVDPDQAHSAAAPACSFLTQGSGAETADGGSEAGPTNESWECFQTLQSEVPSTLRWLQGTFPLSAADAESAIEYAMDETCLPPQPTPRPFFKRVLRRRAIRLAERSRRYPVCHEVEALPACDSQQSDAERAAYALKVWQRMECTLEKKYADVVRRRLLFGEDYAQIATALGLDRPARAKDRYDYAIKLLKRAGIASCFFE